VTHIVIRKSEHLEGEVSAPPSKAYTHRAVIAALLSKGSSTISTPLISDDTLATLHVAKAFGAKIKMRKELCTIRGVELPITPARQLDCGESGATFRFMIPVAALAFGSSNLIFRPSLEKRPIEPLLKSLKQLGVESSVRPKEGNSCVKIAGGGIKGGKTSIRGDITSQFISGLLLACPKARKDTEIAVTTNLESRSYVQMTIDVLSKHGIRVFTSPDFRNLKIPSDQDYRPYDHEVSGDFSSAAFLMAAAAITSSKLKVKNLKYCSIDGNKAIVDILKKMGSKIRVEKDYIEVEGQQLSSINVDATDLPDLVPVVAAVACYSKGTSRICNAKRLRYKESDRLSSIHTELKRMGARISIWKDDLIIHGPCAMRGAIIDPHNDHRIVMSCAVAALGASSKTIIQNSRCVDKSYPWFFDDLSSLGGNIVG
jgi:3-phosphoshikimate 1-carboxyvinyltransferase